MIDTVIQITNGFFPRVANYVVDLQLTYCNTHNFGINLDARIFNEAIHIEHVMCFNYNK